MTQKQPRDYQKDIIEQVVNSDKSTLIQIPTGGGKTFIAYKIALQLITRLDQQVLFVAPRENLVQNFSNWDDSIFIIDRLIKRLEKIIENKEWEHSSEKETHKKRTISKDEFEKIFMLKTKKYLVKKEKSFSYLLEFKKFLDSDEYKQITITRRNQIMEGYEFIE